MVTALAAYPYVAPHVPQIELAVSRGIHLIQQETSGPGPSLPPGQVKWLRPSSVSCTWAEGTLTEDWQLDLEAARRYPAWTTYYLTTAGWWAQAGEVVWQLCHPGPMPTTATCQTVLGNFDIAEAGHLSAANGNSPASEPGTLAADRSWNLRWAANYQRLADIVEQTGCGGAAG